MIDKLSKDVDYLKKWIKTAGVSGVVLMSLIVYFFVGLFNSYALFAIPFCFIVLLYLSNRAIVANERGKISFDIRSAFSFDKRFSLKHLWILALFGLVVGFSQAGWGMGNLIDLIVIGGCIMVILDTPGDAETYELSMKMIVGFALFYAVSIWIEVFLPDVYQVYLSALKNGSAERISGFANYYTGFSTSPGHTATYISAGIFVFISCFSKKPKLSFCAIGFLFFSLLFTGMRMPLLAAVLSVLVCVFVRTPAEKHGKLVVIILAGCATLLLLVWLFPEQMKLIPVIRRTFMTGEAIASGKDATSNRVGLYRLAIRLFFENPIFGIGWGNFRKAVPGNVTITTMFDVHNIFLQLLCETGIVGFVCFVVPMGCFFFKTFMVYIRLAKTQPEDLWTNLIGFSLMYQIYFFAFGMTDNPLYYTGEQVPYFIACAILASYLSYRNRFIVKEGRKIENAR